MIFFYNQFGVNVHFSKSSSAAKSLVLASIHYPYKIFICIGLKIIPNKVLWNFIKISRASCEKTDFTKIQNSGNVQRAYIDRFIWIPGIMGKKRILLLTLTVKELLPKT